MRRRGLPLRMRATGLLPPLRGRGRGLLTLLAALVCTALVLLPVWWMLATSLLPPGAVLVPDPPLLPPPHLLTLRAYRAVVASRPVLLWLGNTVAVTLGSVALSLAIAVLAGYSLSRFRTRGHQAAGFFLLLTKMLPPVLIVVPFFIMFSTFGLLDSLWGLMLANAAVGVPFATWMIKGFFDGIPRELEQAAMIDGCTELGALWRVTMPLARPGIAACAVYCGIVTWADFVFARTLVSHPEHWLVTVGLTSFIGEHNVDWTMFMAAGTLSLLPVFLLFLLLEPFLVSGMTQGSVTG